MAQDAALSAGGARPVRPALSDLAALTKVRIALLSTATAATGFVAAARGARAALVPTIAGTFLLAAGAATLNEVIDRRRDALMERTRARPLPAGRISVGAALAIATASALAGTALLWRAGGPIAALLGAGALVLYDAVYTPLKRLTAFAVLPGALVGALPPAIGWSAAGGRLADPRLHALCAFMLLWQIPHFWLIAARHTGDFARAGFPTPDRSLWPSQVTRVTRVWISATGLSALLLPLFGATRSSPAALGLALAVAGVVPFACLLHGEPGARRAPGPFLTFNLLVVAVMGIVVADALLAS